MPGAVRIANADIAFSANTAGYTRGTGQIIAANRAVARSYDGILLAGQRFSQGIQSSLIATAAYAVGVNAVRSAVGGSVGTFLDYDQALIAIQKTTDLTGRSLGRLGEQLVAINTQPFQGQRALPILRQDLFAISEVVGQLGVRGVDNITRVTRASAALQVSSDLIGRDAARALARYLRVTDQAVERTDAIASGITALGNSVAASESEIVSFAQQIAQGVRAAGGLTNEVLLGIAGTLAEVGARQESASTVLGRALAAINRLAADENAEVLLNIGRAAGVADEEILALTESLRDGTGGTEAYSRALDILIRALSRLPAVGGPNQTSRQDLLESIFGESNVRITRVFGLLSQNYDRLQENVRTANSALETQDEHFREAGRAAEGYRARLQVVGREIQQQGTDIGGTLAPALVTIAENWRSIEVASIGAVGAIGVGRIQRYVLASREAAAAQFEQARATMVAAAAERDRAVVARASAIRAVSAARSQVAIGVAGGGASAAVIAQEQRATRALATANRRLARDKERATVAIGNFNNELQRGTRLARFGAGALNFFGGPVGVVTGLLLAGATAWSLWGDNLRGALADTDDLIERAREQIEELNNQADRRPSTQQTQDALLQELDRLTQARLDLQDELEQGFTVGLTRSFIVVTERRIREVREALSDLEESTAAVAASQDEVTETTARVREQFRLLSRDLDGPNRRLREFRNSILDARAAAARQINLDFATAGLSTADAAIRQRLFQEEESLLQARLSAEREIENITRQLVTAESRLAQAETIRANAAGDQVKEAERQVQFFERQAQELGFSLDAARALATALSGIVINPEASRELAALQTGARQLQELLSAQTPSAQPLISFRATEGVRDLIASLEERITTERRAIVQARELATVDERTAAGLRARFAVENEFYDTRQRALRDQASLEVELETIQAELLEARLDLDEATGREADSIFNLVVALEREQVEARDAIRASEIFNRELERGVPLVEAYARSLQELGSSAVVGPLEALSREASRIDSFLLASRSNVGEFTEAFVTAFEGPLASAIEDFSSGLSEGLISGKLDAEEFIEGLLQGIAQAILQALILRAVFAGLGLAGVGAGGLGLFHEGGTGAHPHQRRSPRSPLRAREKLAVILDDEEVLTRRDPRHRWNFQGSSFDEMSAWVRRLPKYHGGGIAGSGSGPRGGTETTNVTIVFRNPRTGETRTETQQAFAGLRDLMIQIESEDMGRNGALTQIHRQQARM